MTVPLRSSADYVRFGDPLTLPVLAPGDKFLVALDVDGTIMFDDGFISAELRAAIAELRSSGHHVVLATGRPLVALLPVAQELDLIDIPLVATNGSVTASAHRDGSFTIHTSKLFAPCEALSALVAQMPHTQFAVEEMGVGYWVGAPFPEGTIMGEQNVTDLAKLGQVETTRIVAIDAGAPGPQLLAELDQLGLRVELFDIAGVQWMDVAPRGVSKAAALERIRQELGVRAEATVAVGDGGNDIAMLKWAGQGIAMGHAPAKVVAAADVVTGTILDDGAVPVLHDVLAATRI